MSDEDKRYTMPPLYTWNAEQKARLYSQRGVIRICSVENCERPAVSRCDACEQKVCGQHGENVKGLHLCFSCAIGMKDGMEMMKWCGE